MRPLCLPTGRIKALLKWKKKEWNNIMESPYWDLFKNTEIFPPISLHPLNWNYISVLFCLFYVKKLITRLLIAGNIRPGRPGRYHFSQGTVIQRVFSWGQEIRQLLPEDPPGTHPYFISLFNPKRNIPFYSAYKVTAQQAPFIGK